MEFRQLRSFIALVECESFTQAAQKTYVSQPTISTHLRLLEEELGTQLVIRDTKKIFLTDRGRKFFDFAKRVVRLEDQLKQSWLKENDHIRLGASTIPSAYLLPRLLSAFLAEVPDARLSITQADSAAIIDDVRSGIYDLGMVGMRIDDEELRFIPVATDHMALLAPNTPPFRALAAEGALSSERAREVLLENRLVVREEGSGSGASAAGCLEALGLSAEQLSVAATVNSQECINNMVMSDVGITIVSHYAAEEAHATKGLLVFELPVDSTRFFYLVSRKRAEFTPQIEAFVAFLQEEYARNEG